MLDSIYYFFGILMHFSLIETPTICVILFVNCKDGFWILSPKDRWIKSQITQYNEFIENGLKTKLQWFFYDFLFLYLLNVYEKFVYLKIY